MFLIQCPAGHSFPVPAKAAGSIATCPTCGATRNVPKLGELRQFPRAEAVTSAKPKSSVAMGGKVAFAVLMLIAIGTGLTSAFAAFRWQNLPVPMTEEQHIAEESEILGSYDAVRLLSAWEQLESTGLGTQEPFYYKYLQDLKDSWRQVCLVTLGITVAAVVLAFAIVGFARTSTPGADT